MSLAVREAHLRTSQAPGVVERDLAKLERKASSVWPDGFGVFEPVAYRHAATGRGVARGMT
jgi:hypothetical protein